MKIKLSFCTFQGGGFEVLVVDADTGEEVTLSGDAKVPIEDFEILDRIAPACVFTTYESV